MKYIRTKLHGVCKVIKEGKYTISYENKYVVGSMDKDASKIQQADTIEELCDSFVVSLKEVNGHVSYDNNSKWQYELLKKKADLDKCDIYGAIWTDKGLIYVAKMNDKGELELI